VLHTRPDTSDFLVRHRERPRARIVARLFAQGMVLVALLALGWWCVYALGAHALASEEGPSEEWSRPVYVAGCPMGGGTKPTKGSSTADADAQGCSEEGPSHPSGSRRPGAGLGDHTRGAER